MRPAKTLYRIAQNSHDYKICHALEDALEQPRGVFGFPTVLAVRDGVLLGFLGTLKAKDMVVAGPLVVDPTQKAPALTALRLAEGYEVVLRRAGLTSYFFTIDKANETWHALVEKRGFTPYGSDDTHCWYKRELANE